MQQQEKLIQHFNTYGKTDTWLNLAKQFDILPNSTSKQRSDKVRKLYNRWFKKEGYKSVISIDTANPFFKRQVETLNYANKNLQELIKSKEIKTAYNTLEEELEEFLRLKKQQMKNSLITPYIKGDSNNVLVIGDLHTPFELNGYLEFCRKQQEQFNCGTIVFIGDLIDSHFSSYHEVDPDGMSAGLELQQAINKLQAWYYTFPNAIVTIGNHDRIIARKLYTSGISSRWMKPIQEVLKTPTWNFLEEFEYNDVLYIHGEGGTARTKSQQEHISVVQGHNHTECYIDFNKTRKGINFAMQVGTGIDFKQYAFGYAQRGKTPMTSCGVVLNNKQPILIPYQ